MLTSNCEKVKVGLCNLHGNSEDNARRKAKSVRKMSALTAEEVQSACGEPDQATKDYIIQQTMYRIKDPKLSLDFYTRIMGMRLLTKMDFTESRFSLYFMGYEKAADIPTEPKQKSLWTFSRRACLELTHNWGSENDSDISYHNGNNEPRGYGHIGITVPDVDKACERFEQLGVKFVKKPSEGKMKGIAFIQDPDGYWIEILSCKQMAEITP